MRRLCVGLAVFCGLCVVPECGVAGVRQIRALIIDGQNNHDWESTTAEIRRMLQDAGIFMVSVVTSPSRGLSLDGFSPNFSSYDVVVLNYNGDNWPETVQSAFERYIRVGGGLIVIHAADNAFPAWQSYNEMIALGGWGNRDEQSGPYLRLRGGVFVKDHSSGPGGSHGLEHVFHIDTRDQNHPITKGLPHAWIHGPDELYDRLRGPAKNVTVLASAYSSRETGGSGEHEPMLLAIRFGKGRVFHTTLGHHAEAMRSLGFVVTLQRGAEWAATGTVRQKVPMGFRYSVPRIK